ncbi:MAG: phosphoribosylglycinamide formyltransferase [Brevinematales bacterium]|jgi:phosphoribosylglycinamide formyltransferase-1
MILNPLRLGFLASHNGSNMQAIIDACKNKTLNAVPCVVISNNTDSGALQRAKTENIPYYHLSSKTHPDPDELDEEILKALLKHNVNLIILAGYMKKLGPKVLSQFHNKILNIHPALLPKYGGKGMYGNNVHEAVLKAKEKETGVTIHLVNSNYDDGKILNQCRLPVYENDSVDSLSKRVLEMEHSFFVETLELIVNGEIKL